MNDEIKEILDRAKNLKYKCDCCEEISPGKYIMRNDKQTDNLIEAVYIIDKLLDYITNLQKEIQKKEAMYDSLAVDYRLAQEENERLKNDVEDISCSHFSLFKSYEDYKSRVEKAIEYINEMLKIKVVIDGKEQEIIGYNKYLEELLNILQNGSDSQ